MPVNNFLKSTQSDPTIKNMKTIFGIKAEKSHKL